MGIGDWGLGIGDWAQSPIPNPQSPIPNPHFKIIKFLIIKFNNLFTKILYIINLSLMKNKNTNIIIFICLLQIFIFIKADENIIPSIRILGEFT